MPEIEIRPALPSDLATLSAIEPHYETTRVWQMDRSMDEGQMALHFREVRLPRAVKVEYPRTISTIFEEGGQNGLPMLVAVLGGLPIGYIRLSESVIPRTIWVKDCVVLAEYRHKGIGTVLLMAAQDWALERSYRRATIEMQSKNFPAIQWARKLGYDFSGYNDQYYTNQDIALFFTRSLR